MEERKYKAFISYRHLPPDLGVAKQLHKEIERFVIPKELRTNGKKLGYVFRDNDELPISPNLSESIYIALDRSEYLIVVCSPETPKSKWVEREIRYFLKTHDRDHLITVLAAGTPETSFPDLITTVTDETGNSTTDIEPLAANISADSKFKRKRLFKTEKLRIIASLLGCPFDALYKREQRYNRRRLAILSSIIAAVLICFAGMLINRNIQIRKNYEKALHDQSTYLAAESLNLLESNDRFGAIWLAMKALPNDKMQRPLLSGAEYALGKAANAYLLPGSESIQPVGLFSHPGKVLDFLINKNGSHLYSLTDKNTLYKWDNKTNKIVWTYSIGEPDNSLTAANIMSSSYYPAGLANDKHPVVWTHKEILCVSEKGEKLWGHTLKETGEEYGIICNVFLCEKSKEVIALLNPSIGDIARIICFDCESGKIKSDVKTDFSLIGYSKISLISENGCISSDGRMLCCSFEFEDKNKGIAVLDTHSGNIIASYSDLSKEKGNIYFEDYTFLNDKLFFSYSFGNSPFSKTYTTGWGFSVYNWNSVNVSCLDINNGKIVWDRESKYSFPKGKDILLIFTDLSVNPVLVHSYANHIDIINPESGKIIKTVELSSTVVAMGSLKTNICCFTKAGEQCLIDLSDISNFKWATYPYVMDDASKVLFLPGGRFWACKYNSSDIVKYAWNNHDPTWKPVKTDFEIEHITGESAVSDNYFVLIAKTNDESYILYSEQKTPDKMKSILLPAHKNYGDYSIVKLSGDVVELLHRSYETIDVTKINLQSQKITHFSWKSDNNILAVCKSKNGGDTGWAIIVETKSFNEKTTDMNLQIVFLNESLNQIDKKTIAKKSISFDDSLKDHISEECIYSKNAKMCIYYPVTKSTYCIDVDTKEIKKCSAELTDSLKQVFDSGEKINERMLFDDINNKIAVRSPKNIIKVFDSDGNALFEITGFAEEIVSSAFSPDGKLLLIVENDGNMRRYDLKDGSYIGNTELPAFQSETDISWVFTSKDFLGIRSFGYLNLISTNDWEVFAFVPSCLQYQESIDAFWCDSSSVKEPIGYLKRHSVSSLIEYANKILNGWEMSESQKETYGVE